MKYILAAVALAAFSTAATAMTSDYLTVSEEMEIRQKVPGADLSGLTAEEANALASALHSGDGADLAGAIRSILN